MSSGEVLARGADGQCGVQDAFLLPQVIGELLDLHRRSADENHFGTQVVVEVHMSGRQDRVIIVVLQFDEFFAELTDVVVVHQGDGSQRFLLGVLPFVRHEMIPAIRVAMVSYWPRISAAGPTSRVFPCACSGAM